MFTVFVALAAMVIPQGGAGFQGGQGGGGAPQGGRGGTGGGLVDGEEQTFTHILTPGDKTDWKLTAKAGDVAILSVESSIFDPAVEVVDKDGKVVGTNDDVRPGDQDALLMVVFPVAGDYNAHVLNYRSAAGGQYELKIRRFHAETAELGKPLAFDDESRSKYALLRLNKGQVANCTTVLAYPQSPLGPDGLSVESMRGIGRSDRRLIFRAPTDGNFIVPLTRQAKAKSVFEANPGNNVEFAQESAKTRALPKYALDLWHVKLKSGQFLRASADANQAVEVDLIGEGDALSQNKLRSFSTQEKRPNSTGLLALQDCEATVSVRSESSNPCEYKFGLTEAAQPYTLGTPVQSKLRIAEVEFRKIQARAGDRIKFGVHSDSFDSAVRIRAADGDIYFTNSDDSAFNNFDPSFTFLVPKTGAYYVEVYCSGGGGSGPYTLTSTILPVKAVVLGKKMPLAEATEDGTELEFDAAKGTVYMVTVTGSAESRISFADPNGASFDAKGGWVDDKKAIFTFSAAAGGKYRLWLSNGMTSVRVDGVPD